MHYRGLSVITTTLRASLWCLSSGYVATLVAAEIICTAPCTHGTTVLGLELMNAHRDNVGKGKSGHELPTHSMATHSHGRQENQLIEKNAIDGVCWFVVVVSVGV